MSTIALEKLAAAMDDLRSQVSALADRLARLEGRAVLPDGVGAAGEPEHIAAQAGAAEPPPEETKERIAPEILLAISAAVAAYLGERAHVRAVRLISTTRWSQEGRVSIQASHYLNRG
jgi:methylmalonyl-CoA carboxyltransferase large subunit